MVEGPPPRSGPWAALVVALLLPALAHALTGDMNLNLADEGYLWYGVQRTVAGEVPLRDFQAYDPGRYHWCALFAPFFGTGILAVRKALAVYHALGLLCGLLVARRFAPHWAATLFVGVVLELWMFPRHKLFEPATSMMVAWLAVRLLERPSPARHLALGVSVGLAAYLGRNLGLYAGLASGVLVLVLGLKQRAPGFAGRAGAWAGGVLLGTTPLLAMLLVVPGFAHGFAESVRVILEQGANLPRPWPWPWRMGTGPVGLASTWVDAAAYGFAALACVPPLLLLLRTPGSQLAGRAACLLSLIHI